MLISVKVFKDQGCWLSECEAFCVMSQGETKAQALDMLGDAIHSLYPEFKFRLNWINESEGEAYVEPKAISEALGIMIARNRTDNDLTLSELAKLVGANNHNSVYAYETASREASFTKLESLMSALGKNLVITLKDKAG